MNEHPKSAVLEYKKILDLPGISGGMKDEIEEKLRQAIKYVDRWELADQKLEQAQKALDPDIRFRLLVEAEQTYPDHPKIRQVKEEAFFELSLSARNRAQQAVDEANSLISSGEYAAARKLLYKTVEDMERYSRYIPDIDTSLREVKDLIKNLSIAGTSLHQLPSPPADFTGREEEIRELTTLIQKGGIKHVGIFGLGGVGKTAFALKVAEKLTPMYPDAQIYLDLRGTQDKPYLTPVEIITLVIRSYNPGLKITKDDKQLFAIYRSLLNDQHALLLMDNVSDVAQVERLIPPSTCLLFLTSRQRFTLPGLSEVNLALLPEKDSKSLLLKISPRIGDYAAQIAEACGHLPLALRLTAGAINVHPNISLKDYLKRLSDDRQLLKLTGIEASIHFSYDLLSADLQEKWRTLAVFSNPFDINATAAVWDVEIPKAEDLLSELLRCSLLEFNQEAKCYNLHNLLRLYAQERLLENKTEARFSLQRHSVFYLKLGHEVDSLYQSGGDNLEKGIKLFDQIWPHL